MESLLSSLSSGAFLPPPLLQAFPLLIAGHVLPLLPSLAGLFIYSSVKDCPSTPLLCSRCPALFAMSLLCCYCLFFSVFFFFPGWELVCPGGYADLAQGCLWEYHMPLSSPCGLHLPKQSGHWRCWHRRPPGFSVYCGVGML
jgi:hypothetical protein